jgi:chromosomal replication initiator protein
MDFWNQVLSTVKKNVGNQSFDTWFRPIVYQGMENGSLHLIVPTESFKNRLVENYLPLLLQTTCSVAQETIELDISVKSEPVERQEPPETDGIGDFGSPLTNVTKTARVAQTESDEWEQLSPFNSRYTFDNFVVGSSNEFAHAAALAVAEKPAKAYNPLYLYGGPGLGKTHLMHAIGNLVRRKNPKARLCYLSTEQFMNDFTTAIRFKEQGQMLKFRQKYRNIDVLLMDDIQFIAGKTGTQLEFFHTFNAMYDAQKQIVIASDCAPKQLATLEERLQSRFEWGLTADIQPPDFETKLAILKNKASAELPDLRDDVAQFIAGGIRSNIRELEGALTRLIARVSLDGLQVGDIDLDYAKSVLKGIVADENSSISSDDVVRAVATFFSLKPAQIRAKSNARPIAVPRQIAMYICKELTQQSLPQIGKDFGGKHHTTVLHSIRKIETLRDKDPQISAAVKKIVNSLK